METFPGSTRLFVELSDRETNFSEIFRLPGSEYFILYQSRGIPIYLNDSTPFNFISCRIRRSSIVSEIVNLRIKIRYATSLKNNIKTLFNIVIRFGF